MPKNAVDIRYIRLPDLEDESISSSPSSADTDTGTGIGTSEVDLEVGGALLNHRDCGYTRSFGSPRHGEIFLQELSPEDALLANSTSDLPTWTRHGRRSSCRPWSSCARWLGLNKLDHSLRRCGQPRPLRIVLKSLAIALMLLGLVEFVVLLLGIFAAFFPDSYEPFGPTHIPPFSRWPTDYTADVQPFQCHSHNDYWRTVPLKSAIRAGCTGVEADVWLYSNKPSELYVGHTTASLTAERTLKNLYIEPLESILDHHNPNTTFHPTLDTPRNGIFDVDPAQTLVLLIDFKTDGQSLWPIVSQQLEPLRKKRYLTHFNGTAVVNGPVTIVVTGNAPFSKVVENPSYRDMFFDAPLELLGTLADESDKIRSASTLKGLDSWQAFDDFEEREYLSTYTALNIDGTKGGKANQGQGHSGSAPKNAAIYTPANSYYASVPFSKSIGRLFPYPYLTGKQKAKIRHQIAGAHKQGLKVRYWATPAWPLGLREYVWRTLVEEGVDYLNVDDLWAATRGHWGDPERKRHKWGWDWSPWDRK